MSAKSGKALRYAVYTSMMVSGLCLMLTPVIRSCSQKKENDEKSQGQTQIVAEDAYIVINDDQHTLHCGSIIKTANGDFILKFNCGEALFTEDFKAYTKEPSEEKYEHKCEKCFEEERSK